MLFRSAVGSTNTDFQIAAISNGANDMDLTFASDGGSERMRIDSSGNVGIGTTSPQHILDVRSSGTGTNNLISIGNSDNTKFLGLFNGASNDLPTIFADTSQDAIRFAFADDTAFNSGFSEKMRIDSSGNLLVGTTSATGASASGVAIDPSTSGGFIALAHPNGAASGRSFAVFRYNLGIIGNIAQNGVSQVLYNVSSDSRLKDVTGSARGLEVINALNPVAYNWKSNGQADEGLIAQEVEKIVPNAVSQNEDEYYQMDYSKLVTNLIAGMKEQQEQIEQLKTEIQTLKGE